MTEGITGIVHVHSEFSKDGLCSIADLATFAREEGFTFVGLTDHAEDLSVEDLEDLRRECEKHSDESFVMIAGLEFRCMNGLDILAIGMTEHVPSSDPVIVGARIGAGGGLAILAHPGRNDHRCPHDLYNVLHGIEIWNAADDGQIVPPLAGFTLLQDARRSNPAISGFGGVDLHSTHDVQKVTIQLHAKKDFCFNSQMVLHCLRAGQFAVRGRLATFNAHATLNSVSRSRLWAFRKVFEAISAIRGFVLGGPEGGNNFEDHSMEVGKD